MDTLLRKAIVAITPRNWSLKTKLKNGTTIFGKNKPGFGGRGIFIFRESIEEEYKNLELFLNEGGTLIDVGANTGIYTVKAAKFYEKNNGTVIAMEPFIEVFSMLNRNVRANNFQNVKLYNFCVSDQTGPGKLWMNYLKPNTFSLLQKDESASFQNVLMMSLDDLFGWEKLDKLDYIKIDVEGAEESVIKGAKNIIKKFQPIIQMEMSPKRLPIDLPNYRVYRVKQSHNLIFFPKDHPKIKIATELGWCEIRNN